MIYSIEEEFLGVCLFLILGFLLLTISIFFYFRRNEGKQSIRQSRFLFLFSILWLLISCHFLAKYSYYKKRLLNGEYHEITSVVHSIEEKKSVVILESGDTLNFFNTINVGSLNNYEYLEISDSLKFLVDKSTILAIHK